MSILRPCARAFRPAPVALRPAAGRRLHVTPLRAGLSEDDTHRDDQDRKSHIDSHKEDSVSKAKSGKAEWKGELASNSEAAVRADREDIKASEENIKAMQKESEKLAKEQR